MAILDNIFGRKKSTDISGLVAQEVDKIFSTLSRRRFRLTEDIYSPYVADSNFLTLFGSVGEVFFPIDYLASRIAGGKYQLKKASDDSVVWNNKQFNELIDRPNCLNSFQGMVYQHFVYKYVTGNSYIKCVVPEAFHSLTTPIYKKCHNYWVLPPDKVTIKLKTYIPLFGNAEKEDIIDYYQLQYGLNYAEQINPNFIYHDQDGNTDYRNENFIKGRSRLHSVKMAIDNLIPVYQARNVIYTKRGAIGLVVSEKKDETGTIAMTSEEKKKLRDEYNGNYGLDNSKDPIAISETPVTFIRTSLSIQELQPFEETLHDAIMIAGVFGIPSELVPRKDHSTFNNQKSAEKGVYTSKIIPAAKRYASELTRMLGYDRDGYYIDVDFSHVDCLQEGQKEKEEVSTIVSERAMSEFQNGVITLNDYRARIGESKVETPLFDKLLYEMSDKELEIVKKILGITKKSNDNGQRVEKPSVEDEGK